MILTLIDRWIYFIDHVDLIESNLIFIVQCYRKSEFALHYNIAFVYSMRCIHTHTHTYAPLPTCAIPGAFKLNGGIRLQLLSVSSDPL